MRLRTFSTAGLMATAMLFASAASAAPITVGLNYTGTAGGESGQIRFEGDDGFPDYTSRTADATLLGYDVTSVDGNGSEVPVSFGDRIEAFCVQLGVAAGSGTYHLETGEGYFADKNTKSVAYLGRLYSAYSGDIGSSNTFNAAFQLAIWEIVYDAPFLDLESDDNFAFAVVSGFNGAITLANEMLATVKSMTGDGQAFYILSSEGKQDLIITQVPEPGTLLLIGSGLLLGGALRRRSAVR